MQGSPCFYGHLDIAEISVQFQLCKLGLTKGGQLVCANLFISLPVNQIFIQTLKRGTLLMHDTIVFLDAEPDTEERNSSSRPTSPRAAGIPISTIVFVV